MTEGERGIIAYRFPFLIIAVENTRSQKALATARPYLSGGVRQKSLWAYTISFCVCPRQKLLNPEPYMYFMCSESMVMYWKNPVQPKHKGH